jgi:enoyl-CoA hydratase/carnithine racemase
MACGGAFYMLGEVEFVIASDDAVFFDPHVTWGMTAAFEPIQMLSKMPFPEIMRLSLLGAHERMSASRAYEIGLVSEVVPRDELRERVGWAAQVIADAPPLVVQGTMRALWTALEVPRSQAIGMANLFTRIGSDAAAFKAGQDRFAAGERPQWRLR